MNKQNKKQQQIDTSLAHDLDVSQLLEVEVTLRFQAIHLATAARAAWGEMLRDMLGGSLGLSENVGLIFPMK